MGLDTSYKQHNAILYLQNKLHTEYDFGTALGVSGHLFTVDT